MTYVYDKVSRQTVRVDQKNRRTTYVYDDVSQQTSRQYQDATRVTQTYDAAGQRTLLWDSRRRTTDKRQLTSKRFAKGQTDDGQILP